MHKPALAIETNSAGEPKIKALAAAFAAVRVGDVVSLEQALEQGARVDALDPRLNSLVMLAAYHGHPSLVRLLLARGADPSQRNERGQTPLDGAAFLGDLDVLAALLDGGADVNAASLGGRTALMWAAAFNRNHAVRELLARGADPSLTDAEGCTALEHAAAMDAEDAYALLAAHASTKAAPASARQLTPMETEQ